MASLFLVVTRMQKLINAKYMININDTEIHHVYVEIVVKTTVT